MPSAKQAISEGVFSAARNQTFNYYLKFIIATQQMKPLSEEQMWRDLTAKGNNRIAKLSQTISYTRPQEILSSVEARRYRQNQFFYQFDTVHDDVAGSTWDSAHLQSFMDKSPYSTYKYPHTSRTSSGSKWPKQPGATNYYFRTTEDNKNTSHIGFRQENSMIYNSQLPGSFDTIKTRLSSVHPQNIPDSNKYRFVSQSIKFKPSNPINFDGVEPNKDKYDQYRKARLKFIIDKRYPKGMLGVDNLQMAQTQFYANKPKTITPRIRQQPNLHQSYILDSNWATKRNTGPIVIPHKPKITIRKFSNTSSKNYNILSSRQE